MKVTKEEHPTREVSLGIEMEPQELEPYLQRAYQRTVQRVNVPGFRRGKAPRQVIERYYGAEFLLNEALDFLVPEVTKKAVEAESLETMGTPRVEVVTLDPVTLKAKVPLKPHVDLGDYWEIRLPQEPVGVTDEQVAKVLEQLRRELAPWEPAERPVQYDDLVNMDVHGWSEGREIANSRAVDYVVREGSSQPLPGFAAAIVGIGKGETREFNLDLAADFSDATLAGKSCWFVVTVKEIKAKRLAELDDEFAKGVGQGYESLEALRAKLRADLKTEAERVAQRRYEEKAVEGAVQQAKVEMSPMLLEEEVDLLLREQEEALRQRRVSMEDYLKNVGKNPEQLRAELRPVAEERLKRTLVLQKVGEVEGITVTDEDVDKEIDSLTKESAQQEPLRRLFSSEDGRSSIRRASFRRRTAERLAQIARGEAALDAAKTANPGTGTAAQEEENKTEDGGKTDG